MKANRLPAADKQQPSQWQFESKVGKLLACALTLAVSHFCVTARAGAAPPREMGDYVLVQKAYESKDLKAIDRICQHLSLRDILVVNLSTTPPSPWKDEVVLVLLEAPWPGDRVEGKPTPPGSSAPLGSFQLAVDLLAPVLPDENLKMNDRETYAKLTTLNGRKRLADKFRQATGKHEPGNGQNGTGQVESPLGENLRSPQAETATVSSPPDPNPVADKPNMPLVASKTWIWMLAAVFVVGLGLILKFRRAK